MSSDKSKRERKNIMGGMGDNFDEKKLTRYCGLFAKKQTARITSSAS